MSKSQPQDRFLALLDEHKKILYKVAGSYCRNPADREDLVLLEDELGPDRVVFIEWPEALGVEALGAEPALRVVLRHAGGDRREVEVHHA